MRGSEGKCVHELGGRLVVYHHQDRGEVCLLSVVGVYHLGGGDVCTFLTPLLANTFLSPFWLTWHHNSSTFQMHFGHGG